MLKIQFANAQVRDNGYGIYVNGKELSEIISTALGTRASGKYGYNSGLPAFESNSCDVTVIINPHPVVEEIETDEEIFHSVAELEEIKNEQYKEENGEGES